MSELKPTAADWSPESWRNHKAWQMPAYADLAELDRVVRDLRRLPPLVTSWEVEALRAKTAAAGRGEAFILQGGDCAETFESCTSDTVVKLLKVLLQMSFILIHEMDIPVVRVGRIAGQYAKPRSNDTERVGEMELPVYRGDLYNDFAVDAGKRRPDPARLLEAYHKSGLTLNFIRALTDDGGGFADMRHPEYWELDFMKQNRFYDDYVRMVKSIHHAMHFVERISAGEMHTLKQVEFYTSHEALNLWYDSAQTRRVPHRDGWYNLSTHMPWIGNRTRQPEGAHVEYFRGIRNPIGIKVGPPFQADEIVKLIDRLNPTQEEGRIVLITRFGKKLVHDQLPGLIRAVNRAGLPVTWTCDPMHGNTFATKSGIKTRDFDDVLADVKGTFDVHRSEHTILGGIHLELTGEDVTECVGGAQGLGEDHLSTNYQSYCDPRLNYAQALEMAFLVAREWKKSFNNPR